MSAEQRRLMPSILHRLDQADAHAEDVLADAESAADYVSAAKIQELLDDMTERVERHLHEAS
jgi:hypothetical protein